MRMVDKTKRKERRELGHTALSAAHYYTAEVNHDMYGFDPAESF